LGGDGTLDIVSLHDVVVLFQQDSDEQGEKVAVQRFGNWVIHRLGFEYCRELETDGVRVKVVDSQSQKAIIV
jgi:hypothetical protein